MKLNYRDKVLLTAVVVIIVWVVGIMFFIKPAIEDVNAANKALNEAKVTLSDLEDQIEKDKDLQQRINDAYAEVKKSSARFYDYQETQKATQVVDDLLADPEHEIVNKNMSISEYSTMSLEAYEYLNELAQTEMDEKVKDEYSKAGDSEEADDTAADAKVEEDTTPLTIGYYTITFDYSGKAEDVKVFCEKLKSNDERTLVVDTLTMNEDKEDETKVSGTMELKMMVLQKLEDPNADQ